MAHPGRPDRLRGPASFIFCGSPQIENAIGENERVSTVVRIWFASLLLAGGSLLYAQSSSAPVGAAASSARPSGSAKKEAKAKAPLTITPEREAAVLTFVQRNHDELAELLGYLKESEPAEYERAVRDIFRTTERLAGIQERDLLQYELEVAAWTAQSRVQLLAAKLRMGSSDQLVDQLRDALRLQNDAKLALLKHERKKVADRLSKLDADIIRFENAKEDVIDRQLKLLTRGGMEGRPAKVGAKSAVKQFKKTM
jgi:hypothetical protein